jgi:hypothetical protein
MRQPVQRRTAGRLRTTLASILLLLPLAGCYVVESSRIAPERQSSQPSNGCASALGSYALPKAFLRVQVTQAGKALPAIQEMQVKRHNDPSLVFCLDYLSSSLADDKITVRKWAVKADSGKSDAKVTPPTSFLGAVIVNATDRSAYVLEALIRAAFIAVSGDPNFLQRENEVITTLADLEYDPFDPDESAVVNARLTKLGYCLVLENYTFERQKPDVSSYCNAPRSHPNRHTFVTKAYAKAEATPADRFLPGIQYRPRVPYRLEIYSRPDKSDSWSLIRTQSVSLENLSPVLALDIRRAAFAQRAANFIFDQGTLKVACVSKSSEVEGFVAIPLQISKSIVALPASILSVQIDQTQTQTKLVKAEQQLYQVQQAYLNAMQTGNYQSGTVEKPEKYTLPSYALPGDLAQAQAPVAPGYEAEFNKSLAELCAGTRS